MFIISFGFFCNLDEHNYDMNNFKGHNIVHSSYWDTICQFHSDQYWSVKNLFQTTNSVDDLMACHNKNECTDKTPAQIPYKKSHLTTIAIATVMIWWL